MQHFLMTGEEIKQGTFALHVKLIQEMIVEHGKVAVSNYEWVI